MCPIRSRSTCVCNSLSQVAKRAADAQTQLVFTIPAYICRLHISAACTAKRTCIVYLVRLHCRMYDILLWLVIVAGRTSETHVEEDAGCVLRLGFPCRSSGDTSNCNICGCIIIQKYHDSIPLRSGKAGFLRTCSSQEVFHTEETRSEACINN